MDDKVIYTFDEAKDLCCKGELTTLDAAVQCGMKLSTFYKYLRLDVNAYAEFKRNTAKRSQLVSKYSDDSDGAKRKRRIERYYEQRGETKMKKYHSNGLQDKLALARASGMSYGQYSAYVAGLGRIQNG